MEKRIGFKYCVVCGKEYTICPQCEELANRKIMSWKFTCDTRECFQMYLTLKSYVDKEISKEQARDTLKSLGANDLSSYDDNSKSLIDEIMTEPKASYSQYKQPTKNTKFVK